MTGPSSFQIAKPFCLAFKKSWRDLVWARTPVFKSAPGGLGLKLGNITCISTNSALGIMRTRLICLLRLPCFLYLSDLRTRLNKTRNKRGAKPRNKRGAGAAFTESFKRERSHKTGLSQQGSLRNQHFHLRTGRSRKRKLN